MFHSPIYNLRGFNRLQATHPNAYPAVQESDRHSIVAATPASTMASWRNQCGPLTDGKFVDILDKVHVEERFQVFFRTSLVRDIHRALFLGGGQIGSLRSPSWGQVFLKFLYNN